MTYSVMSCKMSYIKDMYNPAPHWLVCYSYLIRIKGHNSSEVQFLCTTLIQEKSNTFRVALASNGSVSFAVFVYLELDWYQVDLRTTSGSTGDTPVTPGSGTVASGSNPLPFRYDGLRSAHHSAHGHPLPYSAQAGFNRGDGTGFYALPGSGTSEILALGNTSYINMSGVWLFRVDGDVSIGGKFTLSWAYSWTICGN